MANLNQSAIPLSTALRSVDTDFAELKPAISLGPVPAASRPDYQTVTVTTTVPSTPITTLTNANLATVATANNGGPITSFPVPSPKPSDTVTVVNWTVINAFTDDLRKALISFVDTTKEGVKLDPSKTGRQKTLSFTFNGTATKNIKPGEIGEFDLVFSYPPGASAQDNTSLHV